MALVLAISRSAWIEALDRAIAKEASSHADRNAGHVLVYVDNAHAEATFEEINSFLASAYSCIVELCALHDCPLLSCVVVFSKWCGYDPFLEPALKEVFVPHSEGSLEGLSVTSALSVLFRQRAHAKLAPLAIHFHSPQAPMSTFASQPSHEALDQILSTSGAHTGTPLPVHDALCLGGTFDHMHCGHNLLITMSAILARTRIVCGVAGETSV
jgi:hypothetical protein